MKYSHKGWTKKQWQRTSYRPSGLGVDTVLTFPVSAPNRPEERQMKMDTIKFLNKINQEIVKLYENHKPYFQSQLNAFIKRYDQYHKKFAEYRNQALKNSKLIIKDGDNPGEPPKKGWEIQTFGTGSIYDYEPITYGDPPKEGWKVRDGVPLSDGLTPAWGYWRPPLPSDPLDVLLPKHLRDYDCSTKERKAIDEKETRAAFCFLLMAIHDGVSDGSNYIKGEWQCLANEVSEVYSSLRQQTVTDKMRMAKIEEALTIIKAYIKTASIKARKKKAQIDNTNFADHAVGYMSASRIAKDSQVASDALRKRLERLRKKNDSDRDLYKAVEDKEARCPCYLYNAEDERVKKIVKKLRDKR